MLIGINYELNIIRQFWGAATKPDASLISDSQLEDDCKIIAQNVYSNSIPEKAPQFDAD